MIRTTLSRTCCLDNLLLVDIYNRAKKLHIDTDVKRVGIIIETHNEKDVNALGDSEKPVCIQDKGFSSPPWMRRTSSIV